MVQRRRVVLAVAVGLLPLLALVAVFEWRSVSETELQITRERETLARAAALVVDVFVRDSVTALEVLARDAAATDDRDPAKVSAHLAAVAEQNPNWDGVGLVDARGLNITVTASAALRSVSIADRDYFRDAVRTGRTAIGRAVIGRFSGRPAVAMGVPVTLASGGQGVLTGVLTIVAIEERLRSLPGAGETGIVVADRAGRAIVNPEASAVAALADLSALPGVRAALRGETGSLRRVEAGDELLIAYAPVTSAGWGVVVRQPTSRAFSLVRSDLQQAAALTAVGALFMLGLAWIVGGRLQRYYDDAVAAQMRAEEASVESERRRRALEQLIAQREEFLSNIGHELKTPLTSVSLAAELIARRGMAAEEPMRSYVELMRQQISRAVSLIGDLLDISRFDRGVPLRKDPVDVGALADAVVERQRALLPAAAPFDLRTDAATGVVIAGDEARLEQVLTNLLSNAVKYSPNGGRIDVRVREEGGRGAITVTDSGIGMTADERQSVFTPFSRGRSATQRGIEGSGLGLYLSKRIVEAHGGQISVASVPGKGTTVAVELPLHAEVREPMTT